MIDSTLQIRTNAADKEAAGKILAQYGVNYSQLVNGLLKEVIRTRSVPFSVDLESVAAKQEKKAGQKKTEIPAMAARQELSLEDLSMVAAAGDRTSVENSIRDQISTLRENLLAKGYSVNKIPAELQRMNPKLYQKAKELGIL